jgi:hypothetical protein
MRVKFGEWAGIKNGVLSKDGMNTDIREVERVAKNESPTHR